MLVASSPRPCEDGGRMARVPDAVQRGAYANKSTPAAQESARNLKRGHARLRRAMAPLIRDRHGRNDPRKSDLPDLRAFERRSRVKPRSVSAAHHNAIKCTQIA